MGGTQDILASVHAAPRGAAATHRIARPIKNLKPCSQMRAQATLASFGSEVGLLDNTLVLSRHGNPCPSSLHPQCREAPAGSAPYKRSGQERAATVTRNGARGAWKKWPSPRRVIPSSAACIPSPCGSLGDTAHSERISDALLDGLPSVPARHEQGGLECSDLSPLARRDERCRLVRSEQTRLSDCMQVLVNQSRPARTLN